MVLGNGGATAFWDVATFGLIRERSQHLSFGEFSSKFATAAQAGAVPRRPDRDRVAPPGTRPQPRAEAGVDVYAWAHNETSTGVMAPVRRVEGADDGRAGARRRHLGRRRAAGRHQRGRRLLLRAAEELRLRRRAVGRGACRRPRWSGPPRSRATDRWVPAFLDLPTAIDNSTKNQTYNTPSVATLFLMAEQLDWLNGQGGLDFAVSRTTDSSSRLYTWAEKTAYTSPYVAEPDERSLVIGTIDFDDSVDAAAVAKVLRANGDRRRRALPQARPQPAAGGDVPGDRPGRRRGAHRLRRPRGRTTSERQEPSAGTPTEATRRSTPQSPAVRGRAAAGARGTARRVAWPGRGPAAPPPGVAAGAVQRARAADLRARRRARPSLETSTRPPAPDRDALALRLRRAAGPCRPARTPGTCRPTRCRRCAAAPRRPSGKNVPSVTRPPTRANGRSRFGAGTGAGCRGAA